jgi:hypothetical protein
MSAVIFHRFPSVQSSHPVHAGGEKWKEGEDSEKRMIAPGEMGT